MAWRRCKRIMKKIISTIVLVILIVGLACILGLGHHNAKGLPITREAKLYAVKTDDVPVFRDSLGVLWEINWLKNITADDDNEPVMVRHGEIVRIFTQNKNVYLMTEDKQYRLRERLYELEEILDYEQFVRISNSEIVNVKKIIRMDTSLTGTILMYMKGNAQTFVSRRYVSKIKKALKI